MIINLEDCLEYLTGLRQAPVEFTVEKTDATIINSIARQVFKGTALTDRQFALMHEKLQKYRDQFINLDWDFDYAVNQLRQPLRHIDRSKYIKLADNEIKIRFPFRKTEIMLVQEISNSEGYYHNKGSHMHTFAYTESNVLNIMDRFKTKEFSVEQEIVDVYKELCEIRNKPYDYLSGILNQQLVNINSNLVPYIDCELGELTDETFVQFVDRRFRYGFNNIDQHITHTHTLENKIALRKAADYHSKPSAETTDAILNAVCKLNRFPLLVILDKLNAEEQLYEFANYFRDIIEPQEQSVLFRVEDSKAGFNQLVKDRKLNNWVDNNTKIVYISKDKLPKLLVKDDWKPTAAFCYNSAIDRNVNSYVTFNCDLIVFREEHMSPMRKHSRYYG